MGQFYTLRNSDYPLGNFSSWTSFHISLLSKGDKIPAFLSNQKLLWATQTLDLLKIIKLWLRIINSPVFISEILLAIIEGRKNIKSYDLSLYFPSPCGYYPNV